MGRIKTEKPQGKLVLRKSAKSRKDGAVNAIRISYFIDGKTIERSTKVIVAPEQWDAVKQKVIKHPDASYLNGQLHDIRLRFDKLISDYDGILRPEIVVKILDGESVDGMRDPKKISFVESESHGRFLYWYVVSA